MRVISGTAKGHKLIAPEGLGTRPTTDRIKETLFNIIQSNINIYETRVLDVFCGSGAIGIEALSRGAQEAVFIDNSGDALEALKHNLNHTKLDGRATVYQKDALAVLESEGRKGTGFDLIFLDPPYSSNLYGRTLEAIVQYGLLNPGGIAVAEQPAQSVISQVSGLKLLRQKDFRKTVLSFWTLED